MDGLMCCVYLVNGVDCFENAALGPLEVAHFDGIVGAVGLEIVHVRRGRVSGSGRHRETIHVAQRTFPADGVITGRTVGKTNQQKKRGKKQKTLRNYDNIYHMTPNHLLPFPRLLLMLLCGKETHTRA
jgi:hypothetical protein